MNVLRRAARVVADEGVAGLFRRLGAKVLRRDRALAEREQRLAAEKLAAERLAAEQLVYEQQVIEFRNRTRNLGVEGLEHYSWYHTIELGGGLLTPGVYDYRGQLHAFGFPESMAGMRVLDVGSATGFFAFEFERRGAEVCSVEMPSLAGWDTVASEQAELPRRFMDYHKADTPEEAYRRHLDGPFEFCRAALGSRVERCYSTVYELGRSRLAGTKFDFIYAGDILLHLFSPFQALDVLSELCDGALAVSIEVPFPWSPDQPLMAFMGEYSRTTGCRTWWTFSPTCIEHMLRRLGFRSVAVVGGYSGIIRHIRAPYNRAVVLARK
jgi:tRNA (mo5U34)-methyltransferase